MMFGSYQAVKAQVSLHKCAVSPESLLLAHTKYRNVYEGSGHSFMFLDPV